VIGLLDEFVHVTSRWTFLGEVSRKVNFRDRKLGYQIYYFFFNNCLYNVNQNPLLVAVYEHGDHIILFVRVRNLILLDEGTRIVECVRWIMYYYQASSNSCSVLSLFLNFVLVWWWCSTMSLWCSGTSFSRTKCGQFLGWRFSRWVK